MVRRLNITACDVINSDEYQELQIYEQINIFMDYSEQEKNRINEQKENSLQKAVIGIKDRYGKNAILKGMNFVEGGTTISRNSQIGGHRS